MLTFVLVIWLSGSGQLVTYGQYPDWDMCDAVASELRLLGLDAVACLPKK